MIPLLVAAVAVCLTTLVVFLVRPTRRRPVTRHPGTVDLGDVERRLAAALPAHHHDFVRTQVGRRRIDAATLWTWLGRFGADALVLALASDVGYAGLLRRLAVEGPLDRAELELLAHLSRPALFVEGASATNLSPR